MLVQFDGQRIVIDKHGLFYDPYYFALAGEGQGMNESDVIKAVLRQWAEALARLESGTAFLPFGIYDQCTECFEAKVLEQEVFLHCVWLDVEGYGIDLLNLSDSMKQSHTIVKVSPADFGVFNRLALITALKEAEEVSNAWLEEEPSA